MADFGMYPFMNNNNNCGTNLLDAMSFYPMNCFNPMMNDFNALNYNMNSMHSSVNPMLSMDINSLNSTASLLQSNAMFRPCDLSLDVGLNDSNEKTYNYTPLHEILRDEAGAKANRSTLGATSGGRLPTTKSTASQLSSNPKLLNASSPEKSTEPKAPREKFIFDSKEEALAKLYELFSKVIDKEAISSIFASKYDLSFLSSFISFFVSFFSVSSCFFIFTLQWRFRINGREIGSDYDC
jgi:hypothetical protein